MRASSGNITTTQHSGAVPTLTSSRPFWGIIREIDATFSAAEAAATSLAVPRRRAQHQALNRVISNITHLTVTFEPSGELRILLGSGSETIALDSTRASEKGVGSTAASITVNGERLPPCSLANHARLTVEMAASALITSRARRIRSNVANTGEASPASIAALMACSPQITLRGLPETQGWERGGKGFIMQSQGMTLRLSARGRFRLYARDCDAELTVSSICRDTEFFLGLLSPALAIGWSRKIDGLYRELKGERRAL